MPKAVWQPQGGRAVKELSVPTGPLLTYEAALQVLADLGIPLLLKARIGVSWFRAAVFAYTNRAEPTWDEVQVVLRDLSGRLRVAGPLSIPHFVGLAGKGATYILDVFGLATFEDDICALTTL